MKRIKTGGRKKKNISGRRITFIPSQDIVEFIESCKNKTAMIESAIVHYKKYMEHESNNL